MAGKVPTSVRGPGVRLRAGEWVQNVACLSSDLLCTSIRRHTISDCIFFFNKRRHSRLFSRIILFVVQDFGKSLIVRVIHVVGYFQCLFQSSQTLGAWVDSCSSILGFLSRKLGILLPTIRSHLATYQLTSPRWSGWSLVVRLRDSANIEPWSEFKLW